MARTHNLVIEEEIRFRIFSYFNDVINKETKAFEYTKFWSIVELLLGLECLNKIPNSRDIFGILMEIPSNNGVFFYIEKGEEEHTFELCSLKERVMGFYNNKCFNHKLDVLSYRQAIVHPRLVTSGYFNPRDRFKMAFVKTVDYEINEQFAYS